MLGIGDEAGPEESPVRAALKAQQHKAPLEAAPHEVAQAAGLRQPSSYAPPQPHGGWAPYAGYAPPGAWPQPYGPWDASGAPGHASVSGETLLPADSALGRAEARLRAVLAAVGAVVRALGGVAQMLDSTAYAAWSSVMAVVAVGQHVRALRDEHVLRWLRALRTALEYAFGRPLALAPSVNAARIGSGPNRRTHLRALVAPLLAAGAAFVAARWLLSRRQGEAPQTPVPKGMARVVEHYVPAHPAALGVSLGEDLFVLQPADERGWLFVRRTATGEQGFVPASHVSPVSSRS